MCIHTDKRAKNACVIHTPKTAQKLSVEQNTSHPRRLDFDLMGP